MSARMPLFRKIGYAVGDYGCNLYWQSSTFFLFYFYTDVLALPIAFVGLVFVLASLVDGCIDPLVWILMDRTRTRWGRYRPWMFCGALPLAASFAWLYWTPSTSGGRLLAFVLVSHILFRICYTAVAVPLASLSARLTIDTRERTTLASLRMAFGAAATATIGFGTQPLATFLGEDQAGRGLFSVAILIGITATAMLFLSLLSINEPATEKPLQNPQRRDYINTIMANRAFLSLVGGLVFSTLSTTALTKSLLYYFKYVIGDETSARYALGSAAIMSLLTAPAWAFLARRYGKRNIWLSAVCGGLGGISLFLLVRPTVPFTGSLFFVWMQIVTTGIQVSYWSTLPDTVEFGEWYTGRRLEPILFGLFMLIQKAALGISAGLYGLALSSIGFQPNIALSDQTASHIGPVMALLSAVGLIGSGAFTWFSPLRHGVHEQLVNNLKLKRSVERGELNS